MGADDGILGVQLGNPLDITGVVGCIPGGEEVLRPLGSALGGGWYGRHPQQSEGKEKGRHHRTAAKRLDHLRLQG